MSKMDEVKQAFASYQADVEKMIQTAKDETQAAVDKALADDELKDNAAAQELADAIKSAHDKLVPPTPPTFEPSNQ